MLVSAESNFARSPPSMRGLRRLQLGLIHGVIGRRERFLQFRVGNRFATTSSLCATAHVSHTRKCNKDNISTNKISFFLLCAETT